MMYLPAGICRSPTWSSWSTWKVAGQMPPLTIVVVDVPEGTDAPVRDTEKACLGEERRKLEVEALTAQPPLRRPSKSSRNSRNRSAACAQPSVDGVEMVIA